MVTLVVPSVLSVRAASASAALHGKWTSLFWRVRPDHMVSSFFDGPSTRSDSVRPTRAACFAIAWPSTTSVRRRMRSCATSGSTKSSTMSAAGVPGRGENTNV